MANKIYIIILCFLLPSVSVFAVPTPTPSATPVSPTPTPTPEIHIIIEGYNALSDPETVTITNEGEGNVDMTGWYMISCNGMIPPYCPPLPDMQTFDFPGGFVLASTESVIIESGRHPCPTPCPVGHLRWPGNNYIWNNAGDSGALYDPEGHLIDYFVYGDCLTIFPSPTPTPPTNFGYLHDNENVFNSTGIRDNAPLRIRIVKDSENIDINRCYKINFNVGINNYSVNLPATTSTTEAIFYVGADGELYSDIERCNLVSPVCRSGGIILWWR